MSLNYRVEQLFHRKLFLVCDINSMHMFAIRLNGLIRPPRKEWQPVALTRQNRVAILLRTAYTKSEAGASLGPLRNGVDANSCLTVSFYKG